MKGWVILLTYDDYISDGNYRDITQDEFDRLLKKAENLLDVITNSFYHLNEFDSDNEWRKQRVKRALISQIDYFKETRKTTVEGLNSVPKSVSLGRTTISQSGSYSASDANGSKSIVSEGMDTYLQGTGLLYRGICS